MSTFRTSKFSFSVVPSPAFRLYAAGALCLLSIGCSKSVQVETHRAQDQSTSSNESTGSSDRAGQSQLDAEADPKGNARSTVKPSIHTEPPAPAAETGLDAHIARVRSRATDEIRIERTAVNSEQFARLRGLVELKTLILDAGQIGDAEVEVLATLTGLTHVRLRDSPLSEAGLKAWSGSAMDQLVILNLPQATVTASSLNALGRWPRVRQLRIGGRQIDDAAVDALAGWPALTSLHLIGPTITDRSLVTIASMEQLASFYLDDCPLSDAAWEQLFQSRPLLHVHIDQFHHDRDPREKH